MREDRGGSFGKTQLVNKAVEGNGRSAFADCMFSEFLRVSVAVGAALTAAVPHLTVGVMSSKPTFPKRPIRIVCLTSLLLSAVLIFVLPFGHDLPRQRWPLAFLFCALLPACFVGIV